MPLNHISLLPRDTSSAPISVDISGAASHLEMNNRRNMSNHATAFGGTDVTYRTSVIRNQRKFFKLKFIFGAWNVRTTNDSVDSIRPERATAIIFKELDKYNIDICALSEVRRPGSGNVIERSHTIFWSGGEKKEAGVGFAISNNLLTNTDLNPISVSDRMMYLRLRNLMESIQRS